MSRVARGGIRMWWWIWSAARNFRARWQGSDIVSVIISFFRLSRRSGIPGVKEERPEIGVKNENQRVKMPINV